jgi:non-specific serine/threonine protein kinase
MEGDRWRQVDKIFPDLIEKTPEQRASFLASLCAEDPTLKKDVEELIRAYERSGSFLNSPAPVSLSSSLVGRTLGSFEVKALIGSGGMGEVYRAWDSKLKRDVAIKVVPDEFFRDDERVARFQREAEILASLNHPHIAAIYSVERFQDSRFLVLELVEGETLAEQLARGLIATAEALRIAKQIADALEAAHDKGIIHRDLKSANIMISARGQVKLLDFGVAKRSSVGKLVTSESASTETEPGCLIGTVDYMSPEQALGHKVDYRSDIFSLGVVLYEAATGCLPFTGANAIETINRIINADPRPIADLSRPIPAWFEQLILKCLVKNPQGRYQSAAAILEHLTTRTLNSDSDREFPIRHNLPHHQTNFIGREGEIARLRQLLAKSRILTLAGPGGVGKTRLALKVAFEQLADYTDGIWFIDLSALSDSNLVTSAIASSAGIHEEPYRDGLERICDYFARRCSLLVIDNCEHLIKACADVVESLVRRCTSISILATSREPLMIAGENVFRVPPLSLPGTAVLADDVRRSEALRLFVDRSTAIQPDFVVSDANVSDVVAICCELEGIPLAIELAASRTRALSIEQIRARLNERFHLLTTGTRTALPRQQTLRATLDWSHHLLSYNEQILFRRTTVFAGGFTLEAAEDVCTSGDIARSEVLDILTQLVDKSLVLFTHENSIRYRLLETVREYGREKLRESGELHQVCRQHADFYLRFVEHARPELLGENQLRWFELLANDYDNVRSALQWLANENDRTDDMSRMVAALRQFWLVRGEYSEGRKWAKEALERGSDLWNTHRAGVLETAGDLAHAQGDYLAARSLLEELLKIGRAIQDQEWVGRALLSLGHVASSQSDLPAASSYYEQSLSAYQLARYRLGMAGAFGSLGSVAFIQADYSSTRVNFEQALAIFRELGATEGIATCLVNLGRLAYIQADYALARTLVEQGLVCFRAIRSRPRVAMALAYLSEIAEAVGDLSLARSLITQSLGIARELGAKTKIATYLNNLGNVAILQREYDEARSLYEEALRIATAATDKNNVAQSLTGLGILAGNDRDYEVSLRLHRQSLITFRDIGYRLGIADSLGMIVINLSEFGIGERAAYLFGAVEAIFESIGKVAAPSERILARCTMTLADAGGVLGRERLMKAKAAGRTMTVHEAIEYALTDFKT